jgi:membrane protein YdbS with pleckstrin-like domain
MGKKETMINVICPACGGKFKGKPEKFEQPRTCPKCKTIQTFKRNNRELNNISPLETRLNKDEKILLISSKHWLVIVPVLLISIIFIIIELFLVFFSPPELNLAFTFLIVCIIPWPVCIWQLWSYKIDLLAVTSSRVIFEHGIFSHNAEEIPLEKINAISFNQSIIGKLFNYGNIQIQTASLLGIMDFKFIQNPKSFRDSVDSAVDKYKKHQIMEQAKNIAESMNSNINSDTIECPYCAEIIKAKAKKCRFCQSELP